MTGEIESEPGTRLSQVIPSFNEVLLRSVEVSRVDAADAAPIRVNAQILRQIGGDGERREHSVSVDGNAVIEHILRDERVLHDHPNHSSR